MLFLLSLLLALFVNTVPLALCKNSNTQVCALDGSSMKNKVKKVGKGFQISTTSCPNYDWSSGPYANAPCTNPFVYEFPSSPKISTKRVILGFQKDKSFQGPIITGIVGNSSKILKSFLNFTLGLALNGVPILSDKSLAPLDVFGGNTNETNVYSYQVEPLLVNTSTITHSPLIGLMVDGIPLYGPYGDQGSLPTDLDECQGHSDSTFPFYHYHVLSNRIYPYSLPCLKGCIYKSNGNPNLNSILTTEKSCDKSPTQYDYSGFKWNMVDEQPWYIVFIYSYHY